MTPSKFWSKLSPKTNFTRPPGSRTPGDNGPVKPHDGNGSKGPVSPVPVPTGWDFTRDWWWLSFYSNHRGLFWVAFPSLNQKQMRLVYPRNSNWRHKMIDMVSNQQKNATLVSFISGSQNTRAIQGKACIKSPSNCSLYCNISCYIHSLGLLNHSYIRLYQVISS
jgi:hypothetical protein